MKINTKKCFFKLLTIQKSAVLLLVPFLSYSQSDKFSCETISKINSIIQTKHYSPKSLDDSLSVFVYNNLLKQIDPQRVLFTIKEIKNLDKHRLQIDNYIQDRNCSFLDDFYEAYKIALHRYHNLIEIIRKEPFVTNSIENIAVSSKKNVHPVDEKVVKSFLKKRILYNVLRDVSLASRSKDSITANFEKLVKLSRDKIFDSFLCRYSLINFTEKDFESQFLNMFCTYFDPHTAFFNSSDKSGFFANLSSDNLSFGFAVSQNEKQELVVQKIVPGSSAYFSEKINEGDQLLGIVYQDIEYKISCGNKAAIQKIFSSDDCKKAGFEFVKKSGERYKVDLSKKLIRDYSNTAYSFIIDKNKKKTGYIKIPSFYAMFDNGKTNVSDDVTKEIYKLKADKVDGLIIDLQGNGGGSMAEAILLSGLFIDFGIIAIKATNNNKKQYLKDPNRGSIYDGPLVVLIDGQSASASEFFANAMQDYKRAIIVGTNSFGKASIQNVYPIFESDKNESFLKLTIEAFYRVSGKSNQKTGITPDVKLPQLFENQFTRENQLTTALSNKPIDGIVLTNEFVSPKRNAVIEKSLARTKIDENLRKTAAMNLKINQVFEQENTTVGLNFLSVFNSVNGINAIWKEVIAFGQKTYDLQVYQSKTNAEYQEFDEYLKSSNIEKITAIKRNLHIVEAVNIINDFN